MGHQDFQCFWEGAMEVSGNSRTMFTSGFRVCIQPLGQPAALLELLGLYFMLFSGPGTQEEQVVNSQAPGDPRNIEAGQDLQDQVQPLAKHPCAH